MSKSNPKKIAAIVINAVIWVFLIFAILVTAFTFLTISNNDGMPSLGGKGIVNILSDSMSPTFKKGDIIIAQVLSEEEKADLKVGDVVTYNTNIDGNRALNSHRIVEVIKTGNTVQYVTKGDNEKTNPIADDPINSNLVLSVWRDGRTVGDAESGYKISGDAVKADTTIGGIGNFIEFLRTSVGFFLCIILPLILFFLYQLINFVLVLVKAKNQKELAAAGNVPVIDEEEIKRRAVEEYLRQQEEAAKAAAQAQAQAPAEAEEQGTPEASEDESTEAPESEETAPKTKPEADE